MEIYFVFSKLLDLMIISSIICIAYWKNVVPLCFQKKYYTENIIVRIGDTYQRIMGMILAIILVIIEILLIVPLIQFILFI